MRSALLLILSAAPAFAASPDPAGDDGRRLEVIRESIRTSFRDLDAALARLDDLTASYAGDPAPAGGAGREAMLGKVSEEVSRLNRSFADFWPLWDHARIALGARLMVGVIAGAERPEAGSSFLETPEIDDLKAEAQRAQNRTSAALAREKRAYQALEHRRRARTLDRVFAVLAGAAAGLGATLLYRR